MIDFQYDQGLDRRAFLKKGMTAGALAISSHVRKFHGEFLEHVQGRCLAGTCF